jgi:hypothetical protein
MPRFPPPPPSYDRETLITAYLRHIAERTDDDFWAWDAVTELSNAPNAEDAWALVVSLVRRAPDEQLGRIGAGPLEDVVNAHGAALVEWIEGECARDSRFKEALGRIWLTSGALPATVEARIVAASGGRIEPMSGDEDVEGGTRPDT